MLKENKLIQLLKIRFPIIQAPMPAIATPRLVAAVSNAGALGSLGAGYMQPEEIYEAVREIRLLTEQPFSVNLFAPAPPISEPAAVQEAYRFLSPYRQSLGIPDTSPQCDFPDFQAQAEVVISEKVPIFSFTFGIPPLSLLTRMKKQGTVLIGTATTLEEADLLEQNGVDAITAQGFEAGGHRAAFLDPSSDPCLTTLSLVPLLSKICSTPVIAAGGLMNGQAIAAALALGAAAGQLGTAFIACAESGAPIAYKNALMDTGSGQTSFCKSFTGRPARMIRNKFIEETIDAPTAPFPYQHLLTKDLRSAASKMNRPDLMSLYAGQGHPLASNLPAQEIIPLLVEQMVLAIQQMGLSLNE